MSNEVVFENAYVRLVPGSRFDGPFGKSYEVVGAAWDGSIVAIDEDGREVLVSFSNWDNLGKPRESARGSG